MAGRAGQRSKALNPTGSAGARGPIPVSSRRFLVPGTGWRYSVNHEVSLYSALPVFPAKLVAVLENVTTGSRFDLTRVSGQPVSDTEIFADLKSVASKLDATTVSQPHYRQYGRYDDTTVARSAHGTRRCSRQG